MSPITTVNVATTLPNSAIKAQIGPEAFAARVAVTMKALEADFNLGLQVHALCDEGMFELVTKTLRPTSRLFVPVQEDASKSMGHGRRQSVESALKSFLETHSSSKKHIILWREPEKDMARHVEPLVIPIEDDEADIVIPRRKNLYSYSTFSQYWEATGSTMASHIIGGIPQDYWVGPRAFTVQAAEYFLNYPGSQTGLPDRHDSIFGPLVDAAYAGLRITGVEIDFQYPQEQRDAEENDIKTANKRMEVMWQIFLAMLARKQWLARTAD